MPGVQTVEEDALAKSAAFVVEVIPDVDTALVSIGLRENEAAQASSGQDPRDASIFANIFEKTVECLKAHLRGHVFDPLCHPVSIGNGVFD